MIIINNYSADFECTKIMIRNEERIVAEINISKSSLKLQD